MTGRLKGKVALVTAAGQGIGRAIATAFIDEGATVIATDVDDSKLKGLKAKQSLALDVLSAASIDALADLRHRGIRRARRAGQCRGLCPPRHRA